MNLLLGLIEPTRGVMRIDSVPLAELSSESWHQRVGYVPQDVFILDASLRDNVTFGAAVDDVRVREALGQAGLLEFVNSLKAGLDSEVGERGRRLSGGQAQRLAIARALYKRPEFVAR